MTQVSHGGAVRRAVEKRAPTKASDLALRDMADGSTYGGVDPSWCPLCTGTRLSFVALSVEGPRWCSKEGFYRIEVKECASIGHGVMVDVLAFLDTIRWAVVGVEFPEACIEGKPRSWLASLVAASAAVPIGSRV